MSLNGNVALNKLLDLNKIIRRNSAPSKIKSHQHSFKKMMKTCFINEYLYIAYFEELKCSCGCIIRNPILENIETITFDQVINKSNRKTDSKNIKDILRDVDPIGQRDYLKDYCIGCDNKLEIENGLCVRCRCPYYGFGNKLDFDK
jgi:hypothetical protein